MVVADETTTLHIFGQLLAWSLLVDFIGFYKAVWFVSVGYATSIVAFCIFMLIQCLDTNTTTKDSNSILLLLQIVGLLLWGVRLGLFLLKREYYDQAYRTSVKDEINRSQKHSVPIKVAIWTSTSLLYVCMFSPIVFSMVHQQLTTITTHTTKTNIIAASLVGVTILWLGLIIETVADHQKSVAKHMDAKTFVHTGLYAVVRYPNYLGEILVWVGNYIASIPHYYNSGWCSWIMATTGLVCILLIMMGSTKRLELKQDKRYGQDVRYQSYKQNVPILIPFITLYSLQHIRVYLE